MSSSTDSRVLIYVQHLLGVGHLQRAILLADALHDLGLQVKLVSGGLPTSLPLPHDVQFAQLAPLYSADASFSRLLDAHHQPIDDAWRTARQQHLLDIYHDFAPQTLITETFPFGRRMLRHELLPLLQANRAQGRLAIASIRDILQPRSKAERELETCQWINEYYDQVLVHGDPRIARLEDSFGAAGRIADKLSYSGYICAPNIHRVADDDGHDEVLVSAGGSATGLQLLRTALAARPHSVCKDLRWRLLVSPAITDDAYAELQRHANAMVVVERNRTDFSTLVQRARLSISQAGYNTMTDILNSDTLAVVIPYAEAREMEQSLRATALARHDRVVVLAESVLTPNTLAGAMQAALQQSADIEVDLDGARQSARQVVQWLDHAGVAS